MRDSLAAASKHQWISERIGLAPSAQVRYLNSHTCLV